MLKWFAKAVAFLWETFKVVLISLLIVIPIRYFVIQPFCVQGASMEPNFEDGEYLVIDELSYRFRAPGRLEVVVFRFPENPKQFYIKRLIGLPGETVEVRENKVIIINQENPNGFVLDESAYLIDVNRTTGELSVKLGEDEYFVLGDNRSASSDSRSWGAVKRHLIVGRVWVRAYPFNKFTVFNTASVMAPR
jgi:signal peptidase I